MTPKQATAYAARDEFEKAGSAYKAAVRAAYPIGTTIIFDYGRHRLEGVVNGYTWEAGRILALNPKSGKSLKVHCVPWSGQPPEVITGPPRCQKCGNPGQAIAECEEHEHGACFCPAHMPATKPAEDFPDP